MRSPTRRERPGFLPEKFGETYITDRGGIDDTPFLYAVNPAREGLGCTRDGCLS